jgi:hypothetical protein
VAYSGLASTLTRKVHRMTRQPLKDIPMPEQEVCLLSRAATDYQNHCDSNGIGIKLLKMSNCIVSRSANCCFDREHDSITVLLFGPENDLVAHCIYDQKTDRFVIDKGEPPCHAEDVKIINEIMAIPELYEFITGEKSEVTS